MPGSGRNGRQACLSARGEKEGERRLRIYNHKTSEVVIFKGNNQSNKFCLCFLSVSLLGKRDSDIVLMNENRYRVLPTLWRREKVKLIRAQGGCLGTKSRRKT